MFVDPRYNKIAHGLMLQNQAGAAAVVGTTGLTEVSSDVAWINTADARLATQRIGDALRDAQRALKQDGGAYGDVTVGSVLLGDPALRVR